MTDTFTDDFGDLLSSGDKNSAQAWDVQLEHYLEEYLKRLHESLSADEGFSKLNFTEPAFIVSKAAKVWGRKVDMFDEILHSILQRAVTGNKESDVNAAASEVHSEDSNSNDAPQLDNVQKKQKSRAPGWLLEDLRTAKDIFRPVTPAEHDNIDLNKCVNDAEVKNTLRPRITFDLHPVYRLPVSIQIKNTSGDVMGDYCDFFSNTFDVEQVKRILDGQSAAAERTMEFMEIDDNDNDESVRDDDLLFSEPVKLEAQSEAIMSLCPNILSAAPVDEQNHPVSDIDSQPLLPPAMHDTEWHSMPGLEPQSVWETDGKQANGVVDSGYQRPIRNRGAGTAAVLNKFLVRLDPYDASLSTKQAKPLAKAPGKPYKIPSQKSKEAVSHALALPRQANDIFSQHMPPLKPPGQMPAPLAGAVSVELSEQMMQKFNDDVLLACGRKSQSLTKIRDSANEDKEQLDEIPATQEVLPVDIDDDDNSSVEDAGEMPEPAAIDLPGLALDNVVDMAANSDHPGLDELPPVQDLEEMLPANVFDESRIKRVQDWDRYVEGRLAAVERTPFNVNDYCVKLVSCGQQTGKRKWFSLEQTVMKMVKEKEGSKPTDAAKIKLGARREGARSLVSLLFLANSGNVELRGKTGSAIGSDLEVRLLSDTLSLIEVDSHGMEMPHRVALAAQDQ